MNFEPQQQQQQRQQQVRPTKSSGERESIEQKVVNNCTRLNSKRKRTRDTWQCIHDDLTCMHSLARKRKAINVKGWSTIDANECANEKDKCWWWCDGRRLASNDREQWWHSHQKCATRWIIVCPGVCQPDDIHQG